MIFFPSRIVPCGTLLALAFFTSLPTIAQDTPDVPVLVTMATDNTQAKESTQAGLRDMLLGWDEQARFHFRTAVLADPDCALAWCGLMLTEGATAESREALERVFAEDIPGTPQETALISTWLRLVQGSRSGAGEEFAERAAQFRNDMLSACWAVLLLHDGYDEAGHKPLPGQQRALKIAEELHARQPENATISYLRGWVEASAPKPSEAALKAAQFAAEHLPEHPAAQLLYGHLLFRTGAVKEAVLPMRRAVELAEKARKTVPHGTMEQSSHVPDALEMWPLEVRAKLYLSTLLWLNGDKKSSLLIQAELLKKADAIDQKYASAPGAVLLHWEAKTLPLRLLMLGRELPASAQINAAAKAAQLPPSRKNDPVSAVRDCLRFCLVARQRAATGQGAQALRCIQSAEAALNRLKAAREDCAGQGGIVLSAWTRAQQACLQALLAAKAAAYPDTADIWLQSLEHEQRPATLLMPPVLPKMP